MKNFRYNAADVKFLHKWIVAPFIAFLACRFPWTCPCWSMGAGARTPDPIGINHRGPPDSWTPPWKPFFVLGGFGSRKICEYLRIFFNFRFWMELCFRVGNWAVVRNCGFPFIFYELWTFDDIHSVRMWCTCKGISFCFQCFLIFLLNYIKLFLFWLRKIIKIILGGFVLNSNIYYNN